MFVDSSTTRLNGKVYPRHLLRESYREAGKVKHRTIANVTVLTPLPRGCVILLCDLRRAGEHSGSAMRGLRRCRGPLGATTAIGAERKSIVFRPVASGARDSRKSPVQAAA